MIKNYSTINKNFSLTKALEYLSKAKNKLNFSPNISLEEGLGYTYKYYSDRINEN